MRKKPQNIQAHKSRVEEMIHPQEKTGEKKKCKYQIRDAEIEGLIREYKKNVNPTQSTMKILEFYGGEDWRTNEGAEMSRCIQRLVEEELVKDYQRDSEPDKETRGTLEEGVTAN